MILSRKIRLKPTPEQEVLFWKSAGVARWAYNYFLNENEKVYAEYLANGRTGKSFADEKEVRRYINNILKPTTHQWLGEVGSNVMKQSIKDASNAWKRYFKGTSNKPRYKAKKKSKPSFYVNYESLSWRQHGFHGERLGIVRTCECLPRIPRGKHYLDPRITFDGLYWYLGISFEVDDIIETLTNDVIGIDLGIKEFAVCSNNIIYGNINKSKAVLNLEKRLRRQNKKFSRKILTNIKEYEVINSKRRPIYIKDFNYCKNYQKQIKSLNITYKRLYNIRENYIHQITNEIVKTKPSKIVMETLNIDEMMRNKNIAKYVIRQKFSKFKSTLKYKSILRGIDFVDADMYYPSSKKCSSCGNIKKMLSINERIYKCERCGLIIDRDLNAAINLSKY